MDRVTRRAYIRTAGVVGVIGSAGCLTELTGDDIQDTDGDGVIDSEDYAPRDPDVQREAQVKDTTTTTTTRAGFLIDDFESGRLNVAWHQVSGTPTGLGGFAVAPSATPNGSYVLTGDNEAYEKYSAIQRDDFTITQDGITVELYVRLGRVLAGSERANRVFFMDGDTPLVVLDQKDRPGSTSAARIGNRNTPNSILDTLTAVELSDIRFNDNRIGRVRVGGNTVASDVPFLNSGSRISAIRVYQGHFAQPDDVIVDAIRVRPT